MVQNTLNEIEERIKKAESIDPTRRAELLDLVENLRQEMDAFSRTHETHAQSIAGLTRTSTAEVTQTQRNQQRLQSALDELSASVTEFEKSHPKLVQVVNRICTVLANIGI